MMTRREAIRSTALATSTVCISGAVRSLKAQGQAGSPAAAPTGPFALPDLPYPKDALEPHIDAKTMEIHHDKHHAAYVTNLNKAVSDAPELGNKKIEDILRDLNNVPEKVRTAVRNQGGGHLNHTLFWQMMKKGGGGEPGGDLARAIDKAFGSFSAFQEKFTETATKVFGSGWAWLVLDGTVMKIQTTPNQDSPITQGQLPLLGIDVWEHAYYLKYQNRRPEYVKAWFNVVNWDFVADRFSKADK
jgi:Fe-Mn family superoxide dismutase